MENINRNINVILPFRTFARNINKTTTTITARRLIITTVLLIPPARVDQVFQYKISNYIFNIFRYKLTNLGRSSGGICCAVCYPKILFRRKKN